MAIDFSEKKRIFSLHTNHSTLQMMADEYNMLLHLYYGPRAAGEMDYLLTYGDRGFSGNPYDAGLDRTYSMDALPQEYPVWGSGDFRSVALKIQEEKGYEGCDLRYHSHTIKKGKYSLPGLPAVYASEEEAETLEIVLKDRNSEIYVTLLYGVLPELDIITRSVKIENCGSEQIQIRKALAANLDFLSGDYDVLTFYGRHGMERNLQRSAVGHGEFRIGSKRGTSSHEYNPLMILAEKTASETAGMCYAMEFVYSGGFQASVEKDQYNQIRMQMGLAEHALHYPVKPGEAFYVPEVIMTFSGNGLEQLSQNLMDCVRTHVCRGIHRDAIRPILLNSWEACYFDFNGDMIRDLGRQAEELGIDMLVMDDGWFGKRDDDYRALGDWYVNEEKLGGTLKELVDDVHQMNLKFGIWVEPEMVNEDSDLYRAHPDWAMVPPKGQPIRARNQLVLDFSRPEVVDEIFAQTCKILDHAKIDYVKWDYNRSIHEVYSYAAKHPGKVLYDYILGLYRFLEQLNQRYPDLLIEGCSGGGGRFDAGMMYYTPQIWCSDNTDAIDRLRIQYGTSFGYPISTVGAHVSAVPNHQSGRITSLNVRGVVAMSGTFGYELDPAKLSKEEKDIIREQIKMRNRQAELIMTGLYSRLSNPFEDAAAAWSFVSRDGSRALLNVVTLEAHCNIPTNYVRMRHLTPGALYRNQQDGRIYPADGLMSVGLPVPVEMEEYRAYQWELVRLD